MNDFDRLSSGCRLCQEGRWLCIFLTYKCNSDCHFCPAPHKSDRIYSPFGNKKEEILSYLQITDIKGISFSGGDPFLVFDRLSEWLRYFKKHFPGHYFWVYTNGIAVTEKRLQQLSAEGMDEIRFNIAATGYIDENIWMKIAIARKLFHYVTIEIPSIRHDFKLLEKALVDIENNRIDYLNLHDYILQETDNEFKIEHGEPFVLNKNIPLKRAVNSVMNTQKIIELAALRKYNFQINHCSLEQKEIQMTYRRKNMGKLFKDPLYDVELEDGIICNNYMVPGKFSNVEFQRNLSDPDFRKECGKYLLKSNERIKNSEAIVRAYFIPPMGTDQGKIFIKAEVL
jgi:uncharacterized protein